MKNLVQTAIAEGNFKTLIRVIQETGFVDILSVEGPFTIFAPTDQAFAKLPKGTMEKLLKDKEKLTEILTYHVILDRVMVKQVLKIRKANTVNGKDLSINTKNGVKIDKANIIKTDIECINGILHIIDEVLIPK
jgi:uncharacterized surface protein with fasciclin (FAS1) repeats